MSDWWVLSKSILYLCPVFTHILCDFFFFDMFSVTRSLSTLYFFLRSQIWMLFNLCSYILVSLLLMTSFYFPYIFNVCFFPSYLNWIFIVIIECYKFFSKTPISYIQILIYKNFSLCIIKSFGFLSFSP